MPIEVPAEPKKYTTVYDNFKGVDFTDDPSNVFKRRSPGGVNMLPDLDGRPYKRKGWCIDTSYTDFITANFTYPESYADQPLSAPESGSSSAILITSFTPYRIHHFTLGGSDYLMFFNSMGVFYKKSGETGVKKCFLATGEGETLETWNFPPAHIVETGDAVQEADPGRSFFFEGAGDAGFYTFVGTYLYKFDGEYYREVDPYIPTTLISCDRYGAGVDYEGINLLTRDRRVQFQCSDLVNDSDEDAKRALVIPGGLKNANPTVEIMTTAGTWHQIQKNDTNYPWSVPMTAGADPKPKGYIQFTKNHVPPIIAKGEDHVRVTYTPSGGWIIVHTDTQTHTETTTIEHTAQRDASKTDTARKIQEQKKPYTASYTLVENIHGYSYTVTYGDGTWADNGNPTIEPARMLLSNPASFSGLSFSPAGGVWERTSYTNRIEYTPLSSSFGSTPESTRDKSTRKADGDFVTASGRHFASASEWIAYMRQTYINNISMSGTNVPVGLKTGTQQFADYRDQIYVLPCTCYYKQSYTYSTSTTETTTTTTETLDAEIPAGETLTGDATAFTTCQKAAVYGSGIINQAFLCASTDSAYSSRMWYSGVSKPNYWPDLNYVEVGSNDTSIMGLLKCGEYLGVVKAGSGLDSSIYLAYPTSFDDNTTYAVKQNIAGVGAISNGAFNILSEEPLFLSDQGVMGVELGEENKLRSRSYFLNGKLTNEKWLDRAVSYVFNGMYYLCVNNNCYVLDGSQKSSWMNEKTNLQYEGYYIENIPAQCFASMGDSLYFTDFSGNLCRFKTEDDTHPYLDAYSVNDPDYISSANPTTSGDTTTFNISDLAPPSLATNHVLGTSSQSTTTVTPEVDQTIRRQGVYYTIISVGETTVTVVQGVPIKARWDTIADDDGAVHFFKNLQKKGCLVSLLPKRPDPDRLYNTSVRVSLKADEKDPIPLQEANTKGNTLPHEFYTKKKIKKYKRLQIICENDGWNDGFGVDQIIKTYTLGNYSKNRGGSNG